MDVDVYGVFCFIASRHVCLPQQKGRDHFYYLFVFYEWKKNCIWSLRTQCRDIYIYIYITVYTRYVYISSTVIVLICTNRCKQKQQRFVLFSVRFVAHLSSWRGKEKHTNGFACGHIPIYSCYYYAYSITIILYVCILSYISNDHSLGKRDTLKTCRKSFPISKGDCLLRYCWSFTASGHLLFLLFDSAVVLA